MKKKVYKETKNLDPSYRSHSTEHHNTTHTERGGEGERERVACTRNVTKS